MAIGCVSVLIVANWFAPVKGKANPIHSALLISLQKDVAKIQMAMSAWPDPEEVLGPLGEMEEKLKTMEASGATLPAIVGRANDITKDMLALKTLVAEHQQMIALLRSKSSLRALGGSAE
jgi:hypothetical protein